MVRLTTAGPGAWHAVDNLHGLSLLQLEHTIAIPEGTQKTPYQLSVGGLLHSSGPWKEDPD